MTQADPASITHNKQSSKLHPDSGIHTSPSVHDSKRCIGKLLCTGSDTEAIDTNETGSPHAAPIIVHAGREGTTCPHEKIIASTSEVELFSHCTRFKANPGARLVSSSTKQTLGALGSDTARLIGSGLTQVNRTGRGGGLVRD